MFKNIRDKILQYKIIFILQVIISIVFAVLLLQINVLPMMYVSVIIALEVILCTIIFVLSRGQKSTRIFISNIISIIISILLCVGCIAVSKGNSTINNLTSNNTQTNRISLYVLKDSSYNDIEDMKNKSIEANTSDNHMTDAISELNKKVKLTIKNIDDYTKMADDLYNKSIDGIYINEAQSALFDEFHTDFYEKTKIIYTYEVKEDIEDFSKDVSVTQNVFNVFISGIDTTGPVSTVSRSDVNMIVTINPKTKQILMTSIPRDYYVTLANKGKKDKLTHAGLAGVENSVKTLENFLGIDINYYARVNFTSLIKMVDALGGIEVYSDKDIPKLDIHQGINQMDGKKALSFSRERYSYKNGDNHRVQNQQKVLEAMLNKMISPAIITNYSSILDNISGSFETNMTSNEITSLIKMQLNDMSKWNIKQIQLEGHGTMMTGGAYMPGRKLYYMLPDDNSVNQCVSMIKEMQN